MVRALISIFILLTQIGAAFRAYQGKYENACYILLCGLSLVAFYWLVSKLSK